MFKNHNLFSLSLHNLSYKRNIMIVKSELVMVKYIVTDDTRCFDLNY